MIESGIEHLKQDGYSEVRLSVYAGNQAIKLYEKTGFKNKTITVSYLFKTTVYDFLNFCHFKVQIYVVKDIYWDRFLGSSIFS